MPPLLFHDWVGPCHGRPKSFPMSLFAARANIHSFCPTTYGNVMWELRWGATSGVSFEVGESIAAEWNVYLNPVLFFQSGAL